MTTPKKRTLKNIDFSGKDAHISLVGKEDFMGGKPANGSDYALVLKGSKFTPEQVEKASQIRVTMNVEDFLQRFYSLYSTEAEVLARALGFTTASQDREAEEGTEDIETYTDWIDSQVASIEVIKQLVASEDIQKSLQGLSAEDYISVKSSQAELEKAFAQIQKDSEGGTKKTLSEEGKASASVTTKVEVKSVEGLPSDKVVKSKGKIMTNGVLEHEGKEYVATEQVDIIKAKAAETARQLDEVQALVKSLQAEKQAAISKARKEKVEAILVTEELVTPVFKALETVQSDEDFDAVMTVLKGLVTKQKESKSDLFKALGADGEAKPPEEETPLMKAAKAAKAEAEKASNK